MQPRIDGTTLGSSTIAGEIFARDVMIRLNGRVKTELYAGQVQYLAQMPGRRRCSALMLKSAIGAITRFLRVQSSVGYAGGGAGVHVNGSTPAATFSGSRASGGSWERSSSQAKNLTSCLRCCVSWSRIVPRNIGYLVSSASRIDCVVARPLTSSSISSPTRARVRK